MIKDLYIRNYAIIEEAHLTFHPGLNVITGESGSGKSVLMDAFSTLIGGRPISHGVDTIRGGADEATLDASFIHTNLPQPSALPMGDPQEEIVLQRIFSKAQRSRAVLNGRPATSTEMKDVCQQLAEIHNQNEHHRIVDANWQLHLLDVFGALEDELAKYQVDYKAREALEKERDDLKNAKFEGEKQKSFLEFQVSEIESAALNPDEELELEQEARLLRNWEAVVTLSRDGYLLLSGEEGVCHSLDKIGHILKTLHEKLDSSLPEQELYETSWIHLKELTAKLRDRASNVDHDPDRHSAIMGRLYLIQTLKKKYGHSVAAILEYQQKIKRELGNLTHCDDRLREVEQRVQALDVALHNASEAISQKRSTVKTALEERVQKELSELGMEKTRFSIELTKRPLSDYGIDRAVFTIALPGEGAKAISKIASGGELSRIVLAFKVVMAEMDPVPTLILDEVDAGVGGATAERIGLRLLSLAKRHQVICITHLPQIASIADTHLLVEKQEVEGRVVTTVRTLTGKERIQEVARMLGGITMTANTLRHAEEMIKTKKKDA